MSDAKIATLVVIGIPAAANGKEVARLQAIIERDRTTVARVATEIQREISTREWAATSRGAYEFDDDDYRKEFGWMLDAIGKAIEPLRKIGLDLQDSPRAHEDVMAAKQSLPLFPTAPPGPAERAAK